MAELLHSAKKPMDGDVEQLDDYEKIITGLPVLVPEKLIKQNPELKNLLLKLTEHISPSGESCQLSLELQKVYEEVKEKRKAFLFSHMLCSELQEMIDNYDIYCCKMMPDSESQEFFETLKDIMSQAEISNYFKACPLLGMQSEFVDDYKIKMPPNFEEKLYEKLEKHLRTKLESFLKIYKEEFPENKNVDDCCKLPLLINANKKMLSSLQEKLKSTRQKNVYLLWKLFQSVMENLGVISEIVKKHRVHQLSDDKDFDVVNFWRLRGEYLKKKIRISELDILTNTYNEETVKALQKIKMIIDEDKKKTKKELAEAKEALVQYEALGDEFQELVKEYEQLKESIENKKWAISQLQN